MHISIIIEIVTLKVVTLGMCSRKILMIGPKKKEKKCSHIKCNIISIVKIAFVVEAS